MRCEAGEACWLCLIRCARADGMDALCRWAMHLLSESWFLIIYQVISQDHHKERERGWDPKELTSVLGGHARGGRGDPLKNKLARTAP